MPGWSASAELWHHRPVSVIKINAITVPEGSGDALAQRFAARAGAVDDQEGFEGFELLKPTDDRRVWLVVTRWRDEEAFNAWVSSPAFGHGHRSEQERSGGGDATPPVAVSSELWSYVTAGVEVPARTTRTLQGLDLAHEDAVHELTSGVGRLVGGEVEGVALLLRAHHLVAGIEHRLFDVDALEPLVAGQLLDRQGALHGLVASVLTVGSMLPPEPPAVT